MKAFDFSSIIVCNNDFTEQTLYRTNEFLSSCGIRKIIFTFDFNSNMTTVPSHIEKLRELNKLVNKCKKRGVFVKVYSSVPATQNALYELNLPRLRMKLKERDYIFLDMSIFANKLKLDSDLNYLIYRRSLYPVFTSFENQIITGENSISEHILKTPNGIFLFDVNHISTPKMIETIKSNLKNNVHMLLCLTNSISNYYTTLQNMKYFKAQLGQANYAAFIQSLGKTSAMVFGANK